MATLSCIVNIDLVNKDIIFIRRPTFIADNVRGWLYPVAVVVSGD